MLVATPVNEVKIIIKQKDWYISFIQDDVLLNVCNRAYMVQMMKNLTAYYKNLNIDVVFVIED